MERLEHAVVRHQRSNKTAAVLFIDLDRFKAVNDTYGHRVGDELLIAVAERLVELIRPCDTAARLDGDEFVILLEDLEAASEATPIVARVKAALARPFVVSGLEMQMTASVGVAVGDDFGLAGKQLLDHADVAMYKAKRGSGHGAGFLDLHQQHLTEHHVGLECDLHWALGAGSSTPSTNRSSPRPADGSPASRRSCAGCTRHKDWCPRRSSYRSPNSRA